MNTKTQRLQEILKLQCNDETEFKILKILIENIDEKSHYSNFLIL